MLAKRVHRRDGDIEVFAYFGEPRHDFLIIPALDRAARFLQGASGGRQRRPRGAQIRRRHAQVRRDFDVGAELADSGGTLGDQRPGGAARAGLGALGLPSGVGGALTGVDGICEGLAVVALVNGVVCVFQRGDGGGVFLGGVGLSAGGARGIDGRLRLIDFLLWRFGTRGGEEQDDSNQKYMRRDPCGPRQESDPRGPWQESDPWRPYGPWPESGPRQRRRPKATHDEQSIAAG